MYCRFCSKATTARAATRALTSTPQQPRWRPWRTPLPLPAGEVPSTAMWVGSLSCWAPAGGAWRAGQLAEAAALSPTDMVGVLSLKWSHLGGLQPTGSNKGTPGSHAPVWPPHCTFCTTQVMFSANACLPQPGHALTQILAQVGEPQDFLVHGPIQAVFSVCPLIAGPSIGEAWNWGGWSPVLLVWRFVAGLTQLLLRIFRQIFPRLPQSFRGLHFVLLSRSRPVVLRLLSRLLPVTPGPLPVVLPLGIFGARGRFLTLSAYTHQPGWQGTSCTPNTPVCGASGGLWRTV